MVLRPLGSSCHVLVVAASACLLATTSIAGTKIHEAARRGDAARVARLLDRKPNPHLAFGGGPHYCLGAHLARLVIRVGISCFLQRIPEFSLSTDRAAERKPNGDARGFKTLPVEF